MQRTIDITEDTRLTLDHEVADHCPQCGGATLYDVERLDREEGWVRVSTRCRCCHWRSDRS